MSSSFSLQIEAWADGAPIPAKFALGRPGEEAPFAPSENVSPAVRWANPPEGTRSFALLCWDSDAPSSRERVNQEGVVVPADWPRADFFHWVLVDIPADVSEIGEGVASVGITPRGKAVGRTLEGLAGQNDYTGWFAGDAEMEGVYGGYDGPCPPWNDALVHRYHFEVFALDVETLGLEGAFTGPEVRAAMRGHVLASASQSGTYSMNLECRCES